MSYAGSGTNALDRGIEAIVYAHQAMTAVAAQAFVGAALRLGHDPAAEALPAGAARRRRLLHLCDLPDLERLPGDVRQPRDRQRRDRQAASDRHPADGAVGAGRAPGTRGGRVRPEPRDARRRQPRGSARHAAGEASGHCDRRLHRQRSIRRLGRAECPPGVELHGDLGREHGRARVDGRPGARRPQPRDHDEPVLGADVHLATEHLRAAWRRLRGRPADQRRRGLRCAGRGLPGRRRGTETSRVDPGGRAVARDARPDRTMRDSGSRRGAVLLDSAPYAAPGLSGGAHRDTAAAAGRDRLRATCIARNASARSAS